MDIGLLSASLFILSFYFSLVGSEIMVAFVTGRSRYFLKSRNFIYTIRALGLVLLIFAALFFKNALGYFGWL